MSAYEKIAVAMIHAADPTQRPAPKKVFRLEVVYPIIGGK